MPNSCRRTFYLGAAPFALKGAGFLFLLTLVFPSSSLTQTLVRPKIGGIVSVTFLTSDISGERDFFARMVDPTLSAENEVKPFVAIVRFDETIQVTKTKGPLPTNLLANVSFATESISKLAKFLNSNNVEYKLYKKPEILTMLDPEGNRISFLERTAPFVFPLTGQGHIYLMNRAPALRDLRIVHFGFIVHNREKMEHFYKDILGFRPYWHGGMKDDGVDDWVSFQVPNGTDWIEFMLNVPDNADKHLRGVMNHIALGVTDIQAAKAQLIKNGLTLTEEPKIGRDGKWQLNVYDPDETRIEFMEFTPKGKTCCSEFTAPHPKP